MVKCGYNEESETCQNQEDTTYMVERLRELCFSPDDVNHWQERVDWFRHALQRLGLSRLQPSQD